MLKRMRSRTHYGHVAAQHIEELRQLIQARAPKKRADSRDAWIATCGLLYNTFFLHMLTHGAELVDVEDLTISALATLREEHGTARAELHRNRACNQDWRDCEQSTRREDSIED